MKECRYTWLGQRPYRPTWDLQQQLVQARIQGRVPDVLLFVEHPPTYTLGRRGNPANLLVPQTELERQGTELVPVDRGGDITYHGPGQLVGYPILDLTAWNSDLLVYVRNLEEVLIRALAGYGVHAERIQGLTGVWVGGNKVAAIGVKVSHNVTSHGFALNVNTDLGYFGQIIPCGIADHGVTSLAALLPDPPTLTDVRERVTAAFGEVFGLTLTPLAAGDLEKLLA